MGRPRKRWYKTLLGERMQHTYWMYPIIDAILKENPQIVRFAEVGTGHGTLSLFLGMHAVHRGDHLVTVDTQMRYDESLISVLNSLGVVRLRGNCFDSITMEIISKHIGERPCFFFCDGGDKPREMETFVDLLPSESIIAAHDYSEEIKDEHLLPLIEKYNLVPLYREKWDDMDDLLTCFLYKP